MNGRTFVDTNVLIYAHDVDAKSKHATAKNAGIRDDTRRGGTSPLQPCPDGSQGRAELAGGEGVKDAEAGSEFGGVQLALAVEPAEP